MRACYLGIFKLISLKRNVTARWREGFGLAAWGQAVAVVSFVISIRMKTVWDNPMLSLALYINITAKLHIFAG